MSLEDMASVLKSMPKYKEFMKKYSIHLEIVNRVTKVSNVS
jgi:hypothetical protein